MGAPGCVCWWVCCHKLPLTWTEKGALDKFVFTSIHHRHHYYQSLEGGVTASATCQSCRLQYGSILITRVFFFNLSMAIFAKNADRFHLSHCKCYAVRFAEAVSPSGEMWAGSKMCWQKHKKVSDADILNLCCLTACHEGPQQACLSAIDPVKVLIFTHEQDHLYVWHRAGQQQGDEA